MMSKTTIPVIGKGRDSMARRGWALGRFAVGVGVVALVALSPRASGQNLRVYFIDVQGGASTLVVTPEGESILIDTGWPGFDDRDPKRIEHVVKDVAKL